MILTEFQLLLALALVIFLIVSVALFFMERDRSLGIKPRVTIKNILVAIAFGFLLAWFAWIAIHSASIITGHPAPTNYPIEF